MPSPIVNSLPGVNAPKVGGLYFAWTEFQRRQVSMAPYFGFETVFMPVERRIPRLQKAFVYLRHAVKMLRTLISRRPSTVWLQLPQVPLLWIALTYRLFNRNVSIVADCHNAMFRPPWSRVPFGVRALKWCDLVLVHNTDVLVTALDLGIPKEVVLAVEDPPANLRPSASGHALASIKRPWAVFPASFAADEPIRELLEAAKLIPDVSILVTGRTQNFRDPELLKSAPENVHFVGYLPVSEFDDLIVMCDAVIALTRYEGVQLSVCGEAVGAGKPMVISGTETLRRLFPMGTVAVDDSDPTSIADGLLAIVASDDSKKAEAKTQRDLFIAKWKEGCMGPVTARLLASRRVLN